MPPIALLGAGLGAAAGAFGDKKTTTKDLGAASGLEKFSEGLSQKQLEELQGLVGAGAGAGDVTAGAQSQRDLGALLQQMQQAGGLPGQEDIRASQGFAGQIFDPQRVAMQQSFGQQQIQANQLAAQLGRSVDDPIIRAKLAQSQTQQQALLQSEQGSFAAQLALQQPDRRLGFAQQRAQVLGGLGEQAFNNRITLQQLGQNALSQQQSFRLGSAGTTESSGGGFGGALKGLIGGIGAGASAAGGFGGQQIQSGNLGSSSSQGSLLSQPAFSQQSFAPSTGMQFMAPGATTPGPWAPSTGMQFMAPGASSPGPWAAPRPQTAPVTNVIPRNFRTFF